MYVIGFVRDSVFNMAASEDFPSNAIMFVEDGSVRSLEGPGTGGALEFLQPIFESAGIDITEVGFYVSGYDWTHSANMAEYPTINP